MNLQHEDTGSCAELSTHPNPEGFTIVFVPSLAAVLSRAEDVKGEVLTEGEILKIRNAAPAVAVTEDQAVQLVEGRGYNDVDPSRPFESWQEMNAE